MTEQPAEKVDKQPASKAQTLGGCLVIAVVVLLIVGACSALLGGDSEDSADSATPTAAVESSSATTTTEEPTTDEAASSERAEPASPTQQLRAAILDKIGDGTRDGVQRLKVAATGARGSPIVVTFASNENLTDGLTKDTLRYDAADILSVVQKEADWKYSTVLLSATYPLVDKLGNTKEETVVEAEYSRKLVEQINFEGFDSKNVFEVADSAFVHPAFQY